MSFKAPELPVFAPCDRIDILSPLFMPCPLRTPTGCRLTWHPLTWDLNWQGSGHVYQMKDTPVCTHVPTNTPAFCSPSWQRPASWRGRRQVAASTCKGRGRGGNCLGQWSLFNPSIVIQLQFSDRWPESNALSQFALRWNWKVIKIWFRCLPCIQKGNWVGVAC